jgi:hypothetical protein
VLGCAVKAAAHRLPANANGYKFWAFETYKATLLCMITLQVIASVANAFFLFIMLSH